MVDRNIDCCDISTVDDAGCISILQYCVLLCFRVDCLILFRSLPFLHNTQDKHFFQINNTYWHTAHLLLILLLTYLLNRLFIYLFSYLRPLFHWSRCLCHSLSLVVGCQLLGEEASTVPAVFLHLRPRSTHSTGTGGRLTSTSPAPVESVRWRQRTSVRHQEPRSHRLGELSARRNAAGSTAL